MESEQELRAAARKRAEEKVGFYVHLMIYIVINAGLWALWYFTAPDQFPWPAFVTIFWGIGVVSHAIGTFFSHRYTDSLAEREYQRMIRGRRP